MRVGDAFTAFRNAIFKRRNAYRALFQPGGATTPAAAIVLADLRRFCRATTSTACVSPVTGQMDPIASAHAEGRREVWLRICQHIHVSDADLYRMVEQESEEDNTYG